MFSFPNNHIDYCKYIIHRPLLTNLFMSKIPFGILGIWRFMIRKFRSRVVNSQGQWYLKICFNSQKRREREHGLAQLLIKYLTPACYVVYREIYRSICIILIARIEFISYTHFIVYLTDEYFRSNAINHRRISY